MLIRFYLNFLETFFIYYRAPLHIFERFGYEFRLEQWVVGEIQKQNNAKSRNFPAGEGGEILIGSQDNVAWMNLLHEQKCWI
jgi:hypothetical protein